MTGRVQAITARSVVLATGGCGKVFPFTTNANIKTGDGMALAFRAGAPLKDMEFVQYHPTGLPFTGILITEAARAEGGRLLNKDGYRYLQDYDLGKPTPTPELRSMELGPRDRLSQAFVAEVDKGRTADTPYGPIVHLDLRHLGEELIEARIPFVRELCLKYERIDPVRELIPVRPVVHYMMGGVHTDIDGGHPARRPVRRRRDRLRQHQRRQPARLELAARAASSSVPARAGPPPSTPPPRATPPAAVARPGRRRGGAGSRAAADTPAGDERLAAIRDEMQARWRPAPASSAPGRRWPRPRPLRELQERVERVGILTTTAGRSTPSWSPRWSSPTCSTSREAIVDVRAAARGVPRRPPAHRLPGPRRRAFPDALSWSTATPTARAGSSTCR